MYLTKKTLFFPVAWNGKVPTLHKAEYGSDAAFQDLCQGKAKLQELSRCSVEQDSLCPEKYGVHLQKTRTDKACKKAGGLHLIKGIH